MLKAILLLLANILTFVLWLKGTISFTVAVILWVFIAIPTWMNLMSHAKDDYNPFMEIKKYYAKYQQTMSKASDIKQNIKQQQ